MNTLEQANMLAVTSLTTAAFVSYLAVRRSESFTFPARYAGAVAVACLAWLALPASDDRHSIPNAPMDQNIERLVNNYDRIRAAKIVGQVREASRRFGAHSEVSGVESPSLAGSQ